MDDMIVLNFEKVALSDDDFIELCADNRDFLFETTARKELIIMTPPGPKTGFQNTILAADLVIWARQDGRGIALVPGVVYHLPNGARRGPDASWVRKELWDALMEEKREKLPQFCPDFVAELMSPSDRRPARFRMLQAKMEEYIANGAELAWLIDPFQKKAHIYRPGQPIQVLEEPQTISGEPVLSGFVFNVAQIWQV